MKAFYVAIAILVVIIGFIFINNRFINQLNVDIVELINDAKGTEFSQRAEQTERITIYWENVRKKIKYTVSNIEIEKIDNYVVMLNSAFENDVESEYNKVLELIKSSTEKIAKLEMFGQIY